MDRAEKVVLMNMCMVCDGNKVLVQDRKSLDWPGLTFPGGHVETGEPFTDAVIREVEEETGLTIGCPKLCGIKSWQEYDVRYVVLLYKTNRYSGTLRSSNEGKVSWIELDDLKMLPLAEGMGALLNVFLDENLGEMFYFDTDNGWKYDLK